MDDRTVTIGGQTATLVVPQSNAEMADIVDIVDRNAKRGCAGALCSCWPRNTKWPGAGVKPVFARCSYDAMQYGGEAWDSLIRVSGISMADIVRAGMTAATLMSEEAITEWEVAEAEDFSAASPSDADDADPPPTPASAGDAPPRQEE